MSRAEDIVEVLKANGINALLLDINEIITKSKKMRDVTPEEQKMIDDYIKSISKPTGVDFGALEQEPCTDAISRQAVLDLANTIETDDYSGNEIVDVVEVEDIKQLPSVTPAEKPNKWIPVNQPPKASGRYLVSMRYVTHDVVETANYATDLHRVDKYDFPKHEAGWYNYDSEYGYYKIENVIVAYMPLPLPYKASPTGAEGSEE